MKVFGNQTSFPGMKALLGLACMAVSANLATGQPGFVEDFTPPLDPVWTQGGDAAGHIGIIGDEYWMTDAWGSPGVKLQRFDTAGSYQLQYTHSIDVTLNPFFLTGAGGTKTDFKFKSFGADGFMEIVLNSFGDMRLYHNDYDGGGGNIQPNTSIGMADGQVLNLTTVYDQGTDTVNVTYSLDGGAAVPFYSGGGIDGPIGNVIGNFVEVELFKWGELPADQGYAAIDQWDLVVVPEPASAALLGIGGLALLCMRRRR